MASAANDKNAAGAGAAGGEAASATGTGTGRSLIWLSGLACGAMVVMVPGVAAVVVSLLAPGLTALKLDKEPGRPVARTVLTCGLAGCVHPVLMLWNLGQSWETAVSIATDPSALLLAWALAAGGWLLTQVAPLLVRSALEAAAVARAARLRAMRERIAEAWDFDGAGNEG